MGPRREFRELASAGQRHKTERAGRGLRRGNTGGAYSRAKRGGARVNNARIPGSNCSEAVEWDGFNHRSLWPEFGARAYPSSLRVETKASPRVAVSGRRAFGTLGRSLGRGPIAPSCDSRRRRPPRLPCLGVELLAEVWGADLSLLPVSRDESAPPGCRVWASGGWPGFGARTYPSSL